jgi:hypothetical protein
MFFNAHTYYAIRKNANANALTIAGGIFPDFAKTRLISWDDLHKKQGILEFSGFIQKSHPKYQSFLDGIIYHNDLDYTSHNEYKNSKPGYAYATITPPLFDLVKQALKTDDATTKSLSHNLIESGVDYHLLNQTIEPITLVKDAAGEIDMRELASILSVFYEKNEDEMFAGVKDFFAFVTRYDLRIIEEWVKLFTDLGTSYLKINVDKEHIKKALELSFKLTKDTWREYLETSIASKNTEIKDCN